MLLGGDIGGTKTNLALFQTSGTHLEITAEEKYSSKDHGSLVEIAQDFIQKNKADISAACFGIAGPVINGEVKATNLPWDVKKETLSSALSIPKIFLINDLESNAWGIDSLKENQLYTLYKGKTAITGNRALISAGTGLGEAGIFYDGKNYRPFATEGGHADFSPRNDKEMALFNYLSKPFGHVSYERVLSGQGLYNIYQFLNDYHKKKPSKQLAEEMQSNDPGKVISQHALDQSDPIARESLEMFVSFYGAEAGNLTLRHLAYGGLYIGGGIAPKILDLLKTPLFIEAFFAKGRLRSVLENISIHVILEDKTALIGAGYCAHHLS